MVKNDSMEQKDAAAFSRHFNTNNNRNQRKLDYKIATTSIREMTCTDLKLHKINTATTDLQEAERVPESYILLLYFSVHVVQQQW